MKHALRAGSRDIDRPSVLLCLSVMCTIPQTSNVDMSGESNTSLDRCFQHASNGPHSTRQFVSYGRLTEFGLKYEKQEKSIRPNSKHEN